VERPCDHYESFRRLVLLSRRHCDIDLLEHNYNVQGDCATQWDFRAAFDIDLIDQMCRERNTLLEQKATQTPETMSSISIAQESFNESTTSVHQLSCLKAP